MTQGEAMYHLFSLAGEAIDKGGDYDQFMFRLQYVSQANLSGVQTPVELLDALDEVKPKWKSL